MDIVNIERKVYEKMIDQFNVIAERVDELCGKGRDKSLQEWLDNTEVCEILNVSKRTLQNYRDCGKLGYTQIGYKVFYRTEDVEKLLKNERNNNKTR